MKIKKTFARFTIDIPAETHQQLKIISAEQGMSMRNLVVEAIDKIIEKWGDSEQK